MVAARDDRIARQAKAGALRGAAHSLRTELGDLTRRGMLVQIPDVADDLERQASRIEAGGDDE